MSRAHYTKFHAKKKPWWYKFLGVLMFVIIFLVVYVLFVTAKKTKLADLIVDALLVDTKVLFLLAINVFIVGGALLVLIFQWVDRENIHFRAKRKAYRSMLICKDYYRSVQHVKVDQFIVQVPDNAERKLDVDYGLKTSSFVTLDYKHIAKEARQTNIAFDENGRLSGLFKTYFTNGNILAEVNYKAGLLHGRCVVYYPNGMLHNEKYFHEGKLEGVFRAWDEDGSLFFEITYVDDLQHGADKSYRKNGVIEYEDIYVKGRMVQRKTFDESGRFKYVQNFTEDGAGLRSKEEIDIAA